MGPIWGRQDPGRPHVGPTNLAIWISIFYMCLVYAAALLSVPAEGMGKLNVGTPFHSSCVHSTIWRVSNNYPIWSFSRPQKMSIAGHFLGDCDDIILMTRCLSSPFAVLSTTVSKVHCPASRTTLVATRFRVAVICPIIQVPHCIRVFFYFVWFVFINHIFQFYYELCTYCDILDIYLS